MSVAIIMYALIRKIFKCLHLRKFLKFLMNFHQFEINCLEEFSSNIFHGKVFHLYILGRSKSWVFIIITICNICFVCGRFSICIEAYVEIYGNEKHYTYSKYFHENRGKEALCRLASSFTLPKDEIWLNENRDWQWGFFMLTEVTSAWDSFLIHSCVLRFDPFVMTLALSLPQKFLFSPSTAA